MSSAALAALLFFAPPGHAKGPDDGAPIRTRTCTANNFAALDAVLPSMASRILSEDPKQGFEAARFLRKRLNQPPRFAVVSSQRAEFPSMPHLTNGLENTVALFTRGGDLLFNHDLIHDHAGDDEEALIKNPDRLDRVLRTIAPVMVHEISHARDAAAAGRIATLETELIAYYREVFYLLDTVDRSDQGADLRRIARELKVDLSAINSFPSTSIEHAGHLAFFRLGNERFERNISESSAYRGKLRILDEGSVRRTRDDYAKSIARFAKYLNETVDESGDLRKTIGALEYDLAVLSNPSKLAAATEHFRVTLEAVRAEADERRKSQAKLLDEFAIEPLTREKKGTLRHTDDLKLSPAQTPARGEKREALLARWDDYVNLKTEFQEANRGAKDDGSAKARAIKKRMAEIKAIGDAIVDDADAYNAEAAKITRRGKK